MNTVVISCGDPAGCGPELIDPLLEESETERLIFVGPPAVRDLYAPRLADFTGQKEFGSFWFASGEIKSKLVSSGRLCPASGEAAFEAFNTALRLVDEVGADGLLTLPLSKAAVQSGGENNFLGHTEYLEKHFQSPGVMSFFGETLNVALLSRHCPLRKVAGNLTFSGIISKIKTCYEFYKRKCEPRFALLGLNPHSGEEGLLGREEVDILIPVIEQLNREGIDIKGPFPADSFLPVHGSEVDLIFSCYHDQGLVPFKQLHFFTGIQATLGLPVLRVSPDHGTAAALAGSGRIDPRSAVNCLKWLRTWWSNLT